MHKRLQEAVESIGLNLAVSEASRHTLWTDGILTGRSVEGRCTRREVAVVIFGGAPTTEPITDLYCLPISSPLAEERKKHK